MKAKYHKQKKTVEKASLVSDVVATGSTTRFEEEQVVIPPFQRSDQDVTEPVRVAAQTTSGTSRARVQRTASSVEPTPPPSPLPAASFESLGIQPWLGKQCKALTMVTPTAVQTACIPDVLNGKHVIGGAVTGSGKTAAFALPIIQLLAEEVYGIFALVLTPSRELAYQIIDQFIALGAPAKIRTAIVIGGVHHDKQLDTLVGRPHVVVATPGRLKFFLEKFPEVLIAFQNLRFLVLDEADRLTEGDIADDTMDVVERLGTAKPFRRVLLFTATLERRLTSCDGEDSVLPRLGITDMKQVAVHDGGAAATTMHLQHDGMTSGASSRFVLPPTLVQKYLFIPVMVKLPYLVALLKTRGPSSLTMVFANSCVRTETVRLVLQLLGFPVCSISSLLTQQQRLNSVAMFKMGLARVLVATDVAARGLDIPEVDLVVHYDFPKLPATYVHRVGRTARAGKPGASVGLVTEHDVNLVHNVERRTKGRLSLFRHSRVNDEAVLRILDEVSGAKVQAKLQVDEQFGSRTATLKENGAAKRSAVNREIRFAGRTNRHLMGTEAAARKPYRSESSGLDKESAEASAADRTRKQSPPSPVAPPTAPQDRTRERKRQRE